MTTQSLYTRIQVLYLHFQIQKFLAKACSSLHVFLVQVFRTDPRLAEWGCSISTTLTPPEKKKRLGSNMQVKQLPLPPKKLTERSACPASTCPGSWVHCQIQISELAKQGVCRISPVKNWTLLFHPQCVVYRKANATTRLGQATWRLTKTCHCFTTLQLCLRIFIICSWFSTYWEELNKLRPPLTSWN